MNAEPEPKKNPLKKLSKPSGLSGYTGEQLRSVMLFLCVYDDVELVQRAYADRYKKQITYQAIEIIKSENAETIAELSKGKCSNPLGTIEGVLRELLFLYQTASNSNNVIREYADGKKITGADKEMQLELLRLITKILLSPTHKPQSTYDAEGTFVDHNDEDDDGMGNWKR